MCACRSFSAPGEPFLGLHLPILVFVFFLGLVGDDRVLLKLELDAGLGGGIDSVPEVGDEAGDLAHTGLGVFLSDAFVDLGAVDEEL